MTREEIKNIPELVDLMLDKCVLADSRTKVCKRLKEVCDLAIKALEQEPSDDAISRQATISTIYDNKSDFKNDFAQGFFADRIRDLPSVNPQKPSISKDGTLIVNFEDDSKVSRVLVCGDDHFGGLYYPEQEPRTGYWITLENHFWKCSECRCCEISKSNWCPNCGAKMVEPQESEG